MNYFNWIDYLVVAVIAYYVYEGWGRGLINLSISLLGFGLSLYLALRGYVVTGAFLTAKFGIPPGWGKLVGFVGVAIVSEMAISEILTRAYLLLPKRVRESRINNWLGLAPSIVNGLFIVSFFLLLLLGMPLRGTVKSDIKASRVGSKLVDWAGIIEDDTKSIFSGAILETVRFVTIKPGSNERVELNYSITEGELSIDLESEAKMLDLVNAEREKAGAKSLVIDQKIVEVARDHSRDMWARQYFSHTNPDGEEPVDRLKEGGVKFKLAGENLALAPDVATAHEGLMNSEGHRKNILDPEFGRVGIGVIDGGVYGKMFTQNFAE